jgi:hypothetical protein
MAAAERQLLQVMSMVPRSPERRGGQLRISVLAVIPLVGVLGTGSCDRGSLDAPSPLGGAGGGSGSAGGGSGGQSGAGETGGHGGIGADGSSSLSGRAGTWGSCLDGSGTAGASAGEGGGSSGSCCRAPVSCVAGLCGDGVLDTCTAPSGPGSCPVVSFSEECDGDDLGGQTCMSLGYGSGTLSCSDKCFLDTKGCSTCAASSAGVAACRALPSAAAVSLLSSAAKDSEMALAWIEVSSDVPQVAFALLSSNLDVISTGHILDAAAAVTSPDDVLTAQIASLPSGWVVVVSTTHSISLYTLDESGNVVAQNGLDPMNGGSENSTPILVSQPNGGPLIIWQVISPYAAVVSADGRSVTAPIEVPAFYDGGGVLPSVERAAFAAGEFQAVVVTNCPLGACLEIISITPIGAIAGSFLVPNVTAPWGGLLVSGADDLRLVYEADCGTTLTDPCLKYLRMSPAGDVLSPPVLLDGSSHSSLPDSAVALGPDSYLASPTQSWSSNLIHISSDGSMVGSARPIAQGGAARTVMARLGSNLVAAWVTNTETIELARLTP